MDEKKLQLLSKQLVTSKDDYMNSLRKNIDLYASQKDITIRAIAEEADISLNTLNSILYGNVKDCKLSTIISLARAFHISIDELVGCETISSAARDSIQITRNLPEHSQYLIHWFIKHQEIQMQHPNRRHLLNVMHPNLLSNGNLKMSSKYSLIDISEIPLSIRPKVFVGMKLKCDHYMPIYSPYDILLIANDRDPHLSENCVILVCDCLFIAKRKVETINGQEVVRYYSIRDQKPRLYEDEVEELIGYIAGVYTDTNI